MTSLVKYVLFLVYLHTSFVKKTEMRGFHEKVCDEIVFVIACNNGLQPKGLPTICNKISKIYSKILQA